LLLVIWNDVILLLDNHTLCLTPIAVDLKYNFIPLDEEGLVISGSRPTSAREEPASDRPGSGRPTSGRPGSGRPESVKDTADRPPSGRAGSDRVRSAAGSRTSDRQQQHGNNT
jgi:hypothetical protein